MKTKLQNEDYWCDEWDKTINAMERDFSRGTVKSVRELAARHTRQIQLNALQFAAEIADGYGLTQNEIIDAILAEAKKLEGAKL